MKNKQTFWFLTLGALLLTSTGHAERRFFNGGQQRQPIFGRPIFQGRVFQRAPQPQPFIRQPQQFINGQPVQFFNGQPFISGQPAQFINGQPVFNGQQQIINGQPVQFFNGQPFINGQPAQFINGQPVLIGQPQQPQFIAQPVGRPMSPGAASGFGPFTKAGPNTSFGITDGRGHYFDPYDQTVRNKAGEVLAKNVAIDPSTRLPRFGLLPEANEVNRPRFDSGTGWSMQRQGGGWFQRRDDGQFNHRLSVATKPMTVRIPSGDGTEFQAEVPVGEVVLEFPVGSNIFYRARPSIAAKAVDDWEKILLDPNERKKLNAASEQAMIQAVLRYKPTSAVKNILTPTPTPTNTPTTATNVSNPVPPAPIPAPAPAPGPSAQQAHNAKEFATAVGDKGTANLKDKVKGGATHREVLTCYLNDTTPVLFRLQMAEGAAGGIETALAPIPANEQSDPFKNWNPTTTRLGLSTDGEARLNQGKSGIAPLTADIRLKKGANKVTAKITVPTKDASGAACDQVYYCAEPATPAPALPAPIPNGPPPNGPNSLDMPQNQTWPALVAKRAKDASGTSLSEYEDGVANFLESRCLYCHRAIKKMGAFRGLDVANGKLVFGQNKETSDKWSATTKAQIADVLQTHIAERITRDPNDPASGRMPPVKSKAALTPAEAAGVESFFNGYIGKLAP